MLLVIGGCTAEIPTGPDEDPLVGRWIGQYISPVGGTPGKDNFTLTVQSGGEAVATGRRWYSYFDDQILEMLFLEMEIAPDGTVSGAGAWIHDIVNVSSYLGEGIVSGALNLENLTGSGKLQIVETEGVIEILWEVRKPDSE